MALATGRTAFHGSPASYEEIDDQGQQNHVAKHIPRLEKSVRLSHTGSGVSLLVGGAKRLLRWIPAFAGMTGEVAGMMGKQAGMMGKQAGMMGKQARMTVIGENWRRVGAASRGSTPQK
jgi:hypothetical protein